MIVIEVPLSVYVKSPNVSADKAFTMQHRIASGLSQWDLPVSILVRARVGIGWMALVVMVSGFGCYEIAFWVPCASKPRRWTEENFMVRLGSFAPTCWNVRQDSIKTVTYALVYSARLA